MAAGPGLLPVAERLPAADLKKHCDSEGKPAKPSNHAGLQRVAD